MKILFLGTHFPRPNNPIIGTWALSQLIALKDLGHEIKVISPTPAIPAIVSKVLRRGTSAECPSHFAWQGIDTTYVRWPVYPVGPISRWFRARPDVFVPFGWAISGNQFLRIARRYAPDVIFAHHGHLSGYVAAKIARDLKVPFFITEHSFGEIESCQTNAHRRRHYLSVVKDVNHWIAVADRMRRAMTDLFPDVPAVTVCNGAELIPSARLPGSRPSSLTDRLVVLCASFFYRRKNVPLLIKAFDSIAGSHPDALLIIIGDGDDKPAVQAAVAAAAHPAQIQLLGALQHDEVLRYMGWCDLFAHIGINEPFGVVFAEAMMAGKPIIYATDCGIADVVVAGTHGLSVRPGDCKGAAVALHELLADRALRIKLGSAAAHLAQTELTWAQNARRLTTLFEASLS
jgi:glycosyltransferase involved in cell wall biosynthesis